MKIQKIFYLINNVVDYANFVKMNKIIVLNVRLGKIELKASLHVNVKMDIMIIMKQLWIVINVNLNV